jgi:hypothetical protein
MAVNAGENVLLITAGGATAMGLYAQALNSVVNQVHAGRISMSSINGSVLRILQLKQKLDLPLPVA